MKGKSESPKSCKYKGSPVAHGDNVSIHGVRLVCEDGKWKEVSREPGAVGLKPDGALSSHCKSEDGPIEHGGTHCNTDLGQVMICDDGKWKLTDEAC